jgi:large subunit ribosomal protein L19
MEFVNMDTKLLESVTKEYKTVKHPNFAPGDIIEVHTRIKEGGKERIQIFKGIVIAIKGAGISKTFTVRKISYGIGVEKIYPVYSPSIAKIKIVKKAKVRRSKLYFLRKRIGKSALKAGVQIPAEGKDLETQQEEEKKDKGEDDLKSQSKKETPSAKKDINKEKDQDKSTKNPENKKDSTDSK